MATIDMQTMRYINLFERISRVRPTKCFAYNNTIYFAVPAKFFGKTTNPLISREISEQIGKRVRVIRDANEDLNSVGKFVEAVVSPAGFDNFELQEGVYVITAGSRERAATLIGRNKMRLMELSAIIQSYFGKSIKVV